MEGDLKLLETLLDRLPLHLIDQYVSDNRKKREEQRKQKFQKHLKPEWQLTIFASDFIQIVHGHRVFGFDTDFEHFYFRIRRNDEQTELSFNRRMDNTFCCHLIKESKTDLTPLIFEWIKFSDKVKTFLMDNRPIVFTNIEKFMYSYWELYLYNKKLWRDAPLWYIRREAYTCLAIYKFRSDSLIARLPKDVLRLILEKLWVE